MIILTPTDGRPEAFSLLRRWLAAQDIIQPVRWIVAGSQLDGYDLTPMDVGPHWNGTIVMSDPGDRRSAIGRNLVAAIDAIDGEIGEDTVVCVVEDDDYYAPEYLSTYRHALADVELTGAPRARYYHVGRRMWRQLRNGEHASLAQTGLRGPRALGLLRRLAEENATGGRNPFLDLRLWHQFGGPKRVDGRLEGLHVSVKGMPGPPNLGKSAQNFAAMQPDDEGAIAREWGLPEVYREFAKEPARS